MSSRRRQARASKPGGIPKRYVFGAALLTFAGAAFVGALLIGGSGGSSTGFTQVPDGYPYPVQAIERLEPRTHFAVGTVYDAYNSNPPTSGEHAATSAQFAISDVPIAKEMVVHNMEHGGAAVWYNCNAEPALSSEACTRLRNELGQAVQSEIASGRRVLMTPYDAMDARIALTAWGFLDTFDEFDAERIRMFTETFECNFDPENFC